MAENRELALVLKLVADQFSSELKKQQGALSSFNSFITDWKTQLTAAGTALFAIAKSTANYGEELLKTSQKVGINVSALSGLQHAAHLADLSHEQLAQGLKFLSVNMVEASRQTGDGEALFRRLGVSATTATGQLRPTEAVLLDLADVFAKSKDGAGKAEVAVKLFGKAGLDLIPFLNQGKTGIKELMDEAARLGLVMSQQDAEAANKFNDELKKLSASMRGVTLSLGKELIPTITELMALLRESGVEGLGSKFLQGLHGRAIGLNVLIKELKANWDRLTGSLSTEQLTEKIGQIEAEGRAKEFELRHPGVLTPASSGSSTSGLNTDKRDIAVVADQDKLGKAKLEIFLAQQRATDIANKQVQDDLDGQAAAYRHMLEFRIQEEKNEEARQEQLGRMIVEQTALEVKVREQGLAEDRTALVQNLQARVAFNEQIDASKEESLTLQLQLIQAELDKELAAVGLTEQQKETLVLQSMTKTAQANEQASDDIIGGWARGMQRYVRDTKSGFGLGADLARRTAQTMEQGFKTFFFDAFEGRIQSFKDMLKSLLEFTKQIASQILGQLATSAVLKGIDAWSRGGASGSGVANGNFSSIFGSGAKANAGGLVQLFAGGGPVLGTGNRDTIPALLTPGEFVLSRRDVSDIKSGLGGGVQVVVNNYGDNEVQTSAGRGPDGKQMIYLTILDASKKAFASGQMDKVLASRFKLIPQAGG